MPSPSFSVADFEGALERQEFILYYQPQIDLFRQRVVGVEALVRWRHPTLGLLAPDQFIDAAEATGTIIDLGRWILGSATERAAGWREEGYDLSVAVNVSPLQVRPALIEEVRQSLSSACLPPSALEIEITENLLLANESVPVVNMLMQDGISIAIDDFGAGYSSLRLLCSLRPPKLKVDRSFLAQVPNALDDCLLLSAIIELGHGIGMTVLAEGVETREQVEFLEAFGIDQMQGYFWGRPEPIPHVVTCLESPNIINPLRQAWG